MRNSRRLLTLVTASAWYLSSACATASRGGTRTGGMATSTDVPAAMRVYDSKAKRFIAFGELADAVAAADLVFFGEQHDDPATHTGEMALLGAMADRGRTVRLSMEMFERDVQPLLDRYLMGQIPEAEFLAGSRPWDQYATDYRPLVELSRLHGWSVRAANVPRPLASAVARRGLVVLDTMNARDRGFMARDNLCPRDAYYQKFVATMQGHGSGGAAPSDADAAAARQIIDRYYEAQCVKDEAMGETVAAALLSGPGGTLVFHVNGAFHSDEFLGTVTRAVRRAPKARVVVLSAVPVPDLNSADPSAFAARGDYILLTRAPKK